MHASDLDAFHAEFTERAASWWQRSGLPGTFTMSWVKNATFLDDRIYWSLVRIDIQVRRCALA